jgi:hypothetical protein
VHPSGMLPACLYRAHANQMQCYGPDCGMAPECTLMRGWKLQLTRGRHVAARPGSCFSARRCRGGGSPTKARSPPKSPGLSARAGWPRPGLRHKWVRHTPSGSRETRDIAHHSQPRRRVRRAARARGQSGPDCACQGDHPFCGIGRTDPIVLKVMALRILKMPSF